MTNLDLSKILAEMAMLLDMQGVAFKPRAFELASQSVESLDDDVVETYKKSGIKGLEDIDGVGKGIAERIEEYIKTGQIKEYEKLKKAFPVDIAGLSRIEGLGPATLKKLYKELGIKNIDDLEKAINSHTLSQSGVFSTKFEEKFKKGLGFVKSGHGRYPLTDIMPTARRLLEKIKAIPKVEFADYGGSLRRMQETVGDLDFIAFSKFPGEVIRDFLKFLEIESTYSSGEHKALVRLKIGIDGDFAVLPPESRGSALIAWAGDKQHNIVLRKLAEKKGWLLNDYGLWHGKTNLASKTEQEVYAKLGMDCIPPELRTNSGEIEAAMKHELPNLIGYEDVAGDLQVQSNWTDGDNSISELAEAAKKYGLQYIAITDHTKSLVIANGNDEKRLLQQMTEIDKINKTLTGFKILKGVEVDIKKDGSLDIADEVLAQLDVVGASVHSHRDMTEEDMTKRIIRAMESPHVDILFHPTGRIVGRREPYKLDMDAVIKVAKRTKTILEVNGSSRLDLKDEHIHKAIDVGVRLSIDSDAHSTDQFAFIEYGIAQARRGWCQSKNVINTRAWREMLKLLK